MGIKNRGYPGAAGIAVFRYKNPPVCRQHVRKRSSVLNGAVSQIFKPPFFQNYHLIVGQVKACLDFQTPRDAGAREESALNPLRLKNGDCFRGFEGGG